MRDTVVQSFLENVERHPDKLCVGFHGVRLTYADMCCKRNIKSSAAIW